jgi:hypothetical protein
VLIPVSLPVHLCDYDVRFVRRIWSSAILECGGNDAALAFYRRGTMPQDKAPPMAAQSINGSYAIN